MGFEFVFKIVGGVIFKEYIVLLEQGMKEVCVLGVLVGYLVIDFKVILVDGFFYDVDLLEMVFKIVGFMVIWEVVG